MNFLGGCFPPPFVFSTIDCSPYCESVTDGFCVSVTSFRDTLTYTAFFVICQSTIVNIYLLFIFVDLFVWMC